MQSLEGRVAAVWACPLAVIAGAVEVQLEGAQFVVVSLRWSEKLDQKFAHCFRARRDPLAHRTCMVVGPSSTLAVVVKQGV